MTKCRVPDKQTNGAIVFDCGPLDKDNREYEVFCPTCGYIYCITADFVPYKDHIAKHCPDCGPVFQGPIDRVYHDWLRRECA